MCNDWFVSGPELEEQKLLILGKEVQIHIESPLTHEADQIKLQRCLRTQLKTSAEAATILDQSRALQGIPKTEKELEAEKGKVWSRLFFASLLVSLVFNSIDTGSDILIMIRCVKISKFMLVAQVFHVGYIPRLVLAFRHFAIYQCHRQPQKFPCSLCRFFQNPVPKFWYHYRINFPSNRPF